MPLCICGVLVGFTFWVGLVNLVGFGWGWVGRSSDCVPMLKNGTIWSLGNIVSRPSKLFPSPSSSSVSGHCSMGKWWQQYLMVEIDYICYLSLASE